MRSGDGEGVTCAQNVSLRSTNLASVWRECRFSADWLTDWETGIRNDRGSTAITVVSARTVDCHRLNWQRQPRWWWWWWRWWWAACLPSLPPGSSLRRPTNRSPLQWPVPLPQQQPLLAVNPTMQPPKLPPTHMCALLTATKSVCVCKHNKKPPPASPGEVPVQSWMAKEWSWTHVIEIVDFSTLANWSVKWRRKRGRELVSLLKWLPSRKSYPRSGKRCQFV